MSTNKKNINKLKKLGFLDDETHAGIIEQLKEKIEKEVVKKKKANRNALSVIFSVNPGYRFVITS